jgi:hypothetical protein
MTDRLPFTLADLEAMSEAEMEAIGTADLRDLESALASAPAAVLRDFADALDLLIDHKKYAAADAHADGDVASSEAHVETVRTATALVERIRTLLASR